MQQPDRYYVPTDLVGIAEGSRIGVSWLILHASDWAGEPLIVVANDDRARWSERVLSDALRFRCISMVAFRSAQAQGWGGGPTVLFSPPSVTVLAWFDRNRLVPALCVVQGSRYDTTAWARAHGPVDLTTGLPYPPGPRVDPAVEQALSALRESMGRNSMSTSRDVAEAVRTLRTLAAEGYPIDPDDLESWALANDWSLVGAHRLAVQASHVSAGDRSVAGR